jgi:N-acetylneuraminic acid mutarotase
MNQPTQAASWVATGSLGTARYYHTATLLPDGKVLVAGGSTSRDDDFSSSGITNSVERYAPSVGTWTPAAPMNIARSLHTATLLPNGLVLVTGGITTVGSTKTAELYDPSVNTWTLIASMTTNRVLHSATLLPNGKVLVAGGFSGEFPDGNLRSHCGDLTKNWRVECGARLSQGSFASLRASACRRRQR